MDSAEFIFAPGSNNSKDKLIKKWSKETGISIAKDRDDLVSSRATPIYYGILGKNASYIKCNRLDQKPFALIDNAIVLGAGEEKKAFRIHYNSIGFDLPSISKMQVEQVSIDPKRILILPPSPGRALFEDAFHWEDYSISKIADRDIRSVEIRRKPSANSVYLDREFRLRINNTSNRLLRRIQRESQPLNFEEYDLVLCFNSSLAVRAIQKRIPILGGPTMPFAQKFLLDDRKVISDGFYPVLENPSLVLDVLKTIEFYSDDFSLTLLYDIIHNVWAPKHA